MIGDRNWWALSDHLEVPSRLMSSPLRQDRNQSPVTIRTIADQVGVHKSTVSRALSRNGNPRSELTRRIRELAEELGYTPHPGAAGLRTHRSLALGVTVPRLTDVVMAALYESIERAARGLGYHALVSGTNDDTEEQRRVIEFMLGRRVDGLIVADAHRDGRHVPWLEERGVPFVLAMRFAGNHPSVTSDENLGGQLAGEHLAELGHRHIAILAGQPWSSAFAGRTAGCLSALHDRGIDVPDDLIIHGPVDTVAGWGQMQRLLERDDRITAAFCVNDDSALGAGGALREHGRRTGVDFALVGYNDVPTAALADLTTVRNPIDEMGTIAVRLLVDQMAQQEIRSVRLAPELVVRGSSVAVRPT